MKIKKIVIGFMVLMAVLVSYKTAFAFTLDKTEAVFGETIKIATCGSEGDNWSAYFSGSPPYPDYFFSTSGGIDICNQITPYLPVCFIGSAGDCLYGWASLEPPADGIMIIGDAPEITIYATPPVINGSCASTHYNCTLGDSADNVSGETQWTWNCDGTGGGTTASCSENKTSPPVGIGLNFFGGTAPNIGTPVEGSDFIAGTATAVQATVGGYGLVLATVIGLILTFIILRYLIGIFQETDKTHKLK